MATLETPMLRWSSVRDCARKAVYEATGAPHRDRTLREERQLARGRSVGRDYIVAIAQESRRLIHVASGSNHWVPPHLLAPSRDVAGIIAEQPIEWALGIGHADGYIVETNTVLEVLSSQHAAPDMIHSKVLQARGYAEGLGATSICLAIVDPATLEDERVIVTHTSPQWADLTVEMDDRVAQVLEWRDGGEMPGRVCLQPSESHGHFCLYAEHCFAGYEPPATPDLDSPEATQLAIQLATVKAKRREITSTDRTLEREQKDIQTQLAGHVPAGEWQLDGYLVKRSPRTRISFALDMAREDSRIPRELIEEFTKSSTYEVWDVERNGVMREDTDAPF